MGVGVSVSYSCSAQRYAHSNLIQNRRYPNQAWAHLAPATRHIDFGIQRISSMVTALRFEYE